MIEIHEHLLLPTVTSAWFLAITALAPFCFLCLLYKNYWCSGIELLTFLDSKQFMANTCLLKSSLKSSNMKPNYITSPPTTTCHMCWWVQSSFLHQVTQILVTTSLSGSLWTVSITRNKAHRPLKLYNLLIYKKRKSN